MSIFSYISSVGNATEWAHFIIPRELAPAYVALTGREWPLSAECTFRLAMLLTKTERDQLPGGRKRGSTFVFSLEPPALAGAHLDDDVDERRADAATPGSDPEHMDSPVA